MLEKLPEGHGDATRSVTNFSSVKDVIPSQRADAVHAISSSRIALDVNETYISTFFRLAGPEIKLP